MTTLQKNPTGAQISDSPEATARKNAIRSVFAAMALDYGEKFERQFRENKNMGKDRILTPNAWQHRLYRSVSTCSPHSIIDGAEDAIKQSTHFVPTLPEISERIVELDRQYRQNDASVERAMLAPPQTDEVDRDGVKKILSGIASALRDKPSAEALSVAVANHDQILAAASGQIRRITASNPEHMCSYMGCRNAGTLTTSTNGGGTFFCKSHFRL
jgi:hypothetical protein